MLQIRNLTIVHKKDDRVLLDDFSLTANPGDKIALIGEEGNGKSTLLKWIYDPMLVAEYMDVSGQCFTDNALLSYLPQELPKEDKDLSASDFLNKASNSHPADLRMQSRILDELGLSPGVLHSNQPMHSMSGGERIKVQLFSCLMKQPDIFLLDEPSNDLDLETLSFLEHFIASFSGSILFISHDETLLERTANRVILMEQLRRKTIPRMTVANTSFRRLMDERQAAFSKQAQIAGSERREERKAQERFRRIEQKVEHSLRTNSRQDPFGGRLLKKKMKSVKALEKRLDREHSELTDFPEYESPITIRLDRQQKMPSGKRVLDLHIPILSIDDGAKGSRILARDISLSVSGAEHICIIGKNGSGKTTLLRRIAEDLLQREDLSAYYMPQNYEESLALDQTPIEYLAPSGTKEDVTMVRTYLGALKYTTDEMNHPIRDLSGGQKAKVLLLKMSLTSANVLILDEPTRNFSPLSAPEIRAILADFTGAIISVSHDRKYMEEVCDKIYRLSEAGLELARR